MGQGRAAPASRPDARSRACAGPATSLRGRLVGSPSERAEVCHVGGGRACVLVVCRWYICRRPFSVKCLRASSVSGGAPPAVAGRACVPVLGDVKVVAEVRLVGGRERRPVQLHGQGVQLAVAQRAVLVRVWAVHVRQRRHATRSLSRARSRTAPQLSKTAVSARSRAGVSSPSASSSPTSSSSSLPSSALATFAAILIRAPRAPAAEGEGRDLVLRAACLWPWARVRACVLAGSHTRACTRTEMFRLEASVAAKLARGVASTVRVNAPVTGRAAPTSTCDPGRFGGHACAALT
jgi:hypothetical protein